MIDLTKIEKPFGLLSPEDQERLKNCGGPWECVTSYGWVETDKPSFCGGFTYRKAVTRETVTYEAHAWWGLNGKPFLIGDPQAPDEIPGIATTDLVDGKPVRIVWEAAE